MALDSVAHDEEIETEQLVLGDLLNHVLDKGMVITGTVTISIADIDLIRLDLRLLLSSVEAALKRGIVTTVSQLASDASSRTLSDGSP